MRLERATSRYPADVTQEETQFEVYSQEIRSRFSKFGGQESTFDVYLNWDDIERAIEHFVELGIPGAMRLKKAGQLAQTIMELANTR